MKSPPVERPYLSTADADATEQDWWNANADLIARVWQMQDEVSNAARRWYLERARTFFFRSHKGPVTIVELGCGSGWVGQAMAGRDLHIVGTDFSRRQIELARRNAATRGLSDVARYETAAADEWPTGDFDGILIHAFLHHLSGRELEGLFTVLRRHVSAGTKLFVYEPAFYVSSMPTRPRFLTPRFRAIGDWIVAKLGSYYRRKGIFDQSAFLALSTLMRTAAENGQYLSPKEVPLDVENFENLLREFADVDRSYWATIQGIAWCVETTLVMDETVRRRAARWILPILMWLDRRIAQDEQFLRKTLVAPNHAFHVWEAVCR
jgi:2-polyprenyl-3-methyl-5-hydroxy-6-metoxy-1,4-benzoquinol methylase